MMDGSEAGRPGTSACVCWSGVYRLLRRIVMISKLLHLSLGKVEPVATTRRVGSTRIRGASVKSLLEICGLPPPIDVRRRL